MELQIALCLVALNALCVHASGYSREKCARANSQCTDEGSKWMPGTESENNDPQSISNVEEELNSLRSKLADFPAHQDKIDEIRDWLKQQKDKNKGKTDKILIQDVSKVITTTFNSVEKLKSKDPMKIAAGVLDIVSTAVNLVGKPYGPIGMLVGIIGSLLTESKQQQPSVVDQLARVVHNEMLHFNRRLQDQKYEGLKLRVSHQIFQLQSMKRGEKLDDSNLWNDYVQFMGELANRLESPLPFKYEHNLTEYPDVADFVTAVVTYSEAYCCFMALLFATKAKCEELGITHKDDEDAVDRKLSCQRKDAQEKLSFLSEKRFLTFLGRLPYEGGKLTKIVALSRNLRGKRVVEAVRGSLDLSPMPDLATVESAASKVAHQSVKVKSSVECSGFLYQFFGYRVSVQFINDVDFPMKIDSGTVGWSQGNQLKFVRDVLPRASYSQVLNYPNFSTGGYMTIYFNNILSSDVEPPPGSERVIEFGLSFVFFDNQWINIQDKTYGEFSKGFDTHNKRGSEIQTLYFFEGGEHYMAQAEVFVCFPDRVWRFVIQDFDPEAVQD